MIESAEDLPSKILLLTTTVQQSNAELKGILTEILQELQNSRIEPNSKLTELKNLGTTGLKEISAITENMTSFFNHQKKLNSFNKRLEKSRKHFGSIWKISRNTKKQSFWYHYKSSRLF